LVDLILRKKIHLNKDSQTSMRGNTAFHLACMTLKKASIEKLLLARVNVNIQNHDGDTGLHILVKTYEQSYDKSNVEDILHLVLPFCENCLNLKN